MKRNNILKRGNGFKKVVGNSLKKSPLKKSSFKRTISHIQKDVKELDNRFSKFIINRDSKCMRCGTTKMLSCSHFEGRSNYSTRFEPDNCVTFCIPCHQIMESKKKEGMEYHQFMLALLGEDKFYALKQLSKKRVNKEQALLKARNFLIIIEINNDIKF